MAGGKPSKASLPKGTKVGSNSQLGARASDISGAKGGKAKPSKGNGASKVKS